MKQISFIEPGLINNFRLLTRLQLGVILIGICMSTFVGTNLLTNSRASFRLLWYMAAQSAILLVYLSIPWLQRKLKKYFLPAALLYTTSITLLLHYLSLYYQANRNLFFLMAIELQLIPQLFIPLVLIAWQYRFRIVVSFCMVTLIAQFVIISTFTNTQQILTAATYGVIVIRTISFLTVGYMVSQLMISQRRQRKELAQANMTLSKYSDTLEQLTLSQERNRLARELHDTLAHTLGGIAIQLEAIQTLVDDNDRQVQDKLQQALEATRSGLKETRRALKNLRASPLDDLGLKLALERLSSTFSERARLEIKTKIPEKLPYLNPEFEQGVFRIAQEALENIIRHANAQHVWLVVKQDDEQLHLLIHDDGQGFDTGKIQAESKLGMTGMQERAHLLGGSLEIDSSSNGTSVHLTLEI